MEFIEKIHTQVDLRSWNLLFRGPVYMLCDLVKK